ncbi:60Kd inner membrane protein-domain-containing protein [Phlebopus sp. FC_14]|nr:60Kd inner membrane protein-domain-containing protein [Phlebopus sp. FC_14]
MLRSAARLSLRASGTRVAPLIPGKPSGSLPLLQPSKLLVRSVPAVGIVGFRSYWWSKSSAPATADTKTTTPPLPEELKASSPASSFSEASQSTTNASSDAVTPSSDSVVSHDVSATVPPPESLPVESDVTEVVNLIPPLQYGDLSALGLVHWSPVGLATWSLEVLQVTTGMPWFYAIIAGSVIWRIALLPLAISSIRNAALLRPHQAEMKALDDKFSTADHTTKLEIALKKQSIIDQSGFEFGTSAKAAVLQAVAQLSLFLSVKGMVTLPVQQLQNSGFPYLPDLTVPDPYYILPALAVALGNMSITLAKKDLDTPRQQHVMNFLRLVSVAFSGFMSWLPSGLWLSVVTGLTVTVLQSAILRNPIVRRKLSINPVVDNNLNITTMESLAVFRKELNAIFGSRAPSSRAAKPIRSKNSRVSIRG